MSDLFFNLLEFAAILGAGGVCVVAGVALLALIDGFKEVMKERKGDDHGT